MFTRDEARIEVSKGCTLGCHDIIFSTFVASDKLMNFENSTSPSCHFIFPFFFFS